MPSFAPRAAGPLCVAELCPVVALVDPRAMVWMKLEPPWQSSRNHRILMGRIYRNQWENEPSPTGMFLLILYVYIYIVYIYMHILIYIDIYVYSIYGIYGGFLKWGSPKWMVYNGKSY